MKVLVAPNALKGSLTALDAASIIASALPENIYSFLCPIADGGNSTLECLVNATGGVYRIAEVSAPIPQSKIHARWGVLGDSQTAVIEMAEAAGLHLLTPVQYNVANATTRGVGELIRIILEKGYKKIIVGLGGSATHDCGSGCMQALGVKFHDKEGIELPDGGGALSLLASIDASHAVAQLRKCEITALTDVKIPLTGVRGAAKTFSPQKGADDAMVMKLEAATVVFENIIRSNPFSVDTHAPGMGAAGGLASALAAFCGATLVSGVDFVLDTVNADKYMRDCDLVITTEGKLDSQTEQGKGIAGIAARAQKYGKPVVAFVGRADGNRDCLCRRLGLKDIIEISPRSLPLLEAMSEGRQRLSLAVREYFSH